MANFSVNRVTFIGNLGNTPAFKDYGNDFLKATFSLATTEYWHDKEQARQERTDWHRVEVKGRLAEIVRDRAVKGSLVYVEGRLRSDRVENKEQPGKFNYFVWVDADVVRVLNEKQAADHQQQGAGEGQPPAGDESEQGRAAGGQASAANLPAAAAPSSAPAATPSKGGQARKPWVRTGGQKTAA